MTDYVAKAREEREALIWAEQVYCPRENCSARPGAKCDYVGGMVRPPHRARVAAAKAAGHGPPVGRPRKVDKAGIRFDVRLGSAHVEELDRLAEQYETGGRAGAVRLLIDESAARRARQGAVVSTAWAT